MQPASEFFATLRLWLYSPNLDGLVRTATDEDGAIGAEGHIPNIVRMAGEGAQFAPGGQFPELDGLVIAATRGRFCGDLVVEYASASGSCIKQREEIMCR